MQITRKLDWGRYVSPVSDRSNTPYNWYSFKHRFGSELVSNIFELFKLNENSVVFDPFCGGGTTLIKAKIDGFHSVGLDISPFSVFLTNVLTTNYDPNVLRNCIKKISHNINEKTKIPDVSILDKSFSQKTLKYLFSLRTSINHLDYPERHFFLLPLLSILNKISKAKKSGGFLRITSQRKISQGIARKTFEREVSRFIQELQQFQFKDVTTSVVLGDARNYPPEIKLRRFDAILTSPPYPNRHDYTRIYELELLLGFIDDNKHLKSLRYNTLRSHVEAKKIFNAEGYKIPDLLEQQMSTLKIKTLNNPKIISTLYGYFEDMYLSLKEMAGVLKENGHIGLVVSNVRFGGVSIPVDQILGEIGEQVGLKVKNIYVLRYRGNSSQQMAEFKREPTRESLLVWKK